MKIAIGVMTCQKYKKRYDTIKNTWGKDFENIYYFGGDQSNPDEIIKLDYPDQYSSILYIQHDIYEYLYNAHPDADWYCVINDDAVLFKDNLMHILNQYDASNDLYLGTAKRENLCLGNYDLTGGKYSGVYYASGGPGFFISNPLMKKMVPKNKEMLSLWINDCPRRFRLMTQFIDAGLAYQLYEFFNVSVTDINTEDYRLYTQLPKHYIENKGEQICKNPMGYHYVTPEIMVDFYNKYISGKAIK